MMVWMGVWGIAAIQFAYAAIVVAGREPFWLWSVFVKMSPLYTVVLFYTPFITFVLVLQILDEAFCLLGDRRPISHPITYRTCRKKGYPGQYTVPCFYWPAGWRVHYRQATVEVAREEVELCWNGWAWTWFIDIGLMILSTSVLPAAVAAKMDMPLRANRDFLYFVIAGVCIQCTIKLLVRKYLPTWYWYNVRFRVLYSKIVEEILQKHDANEKVDPTTLVPGDPCAYVPHAYYVANKVFARIGFKPTMQTNGVATAHNMVFQSEALKIMEAEKYLECVRPTLLDLARVVYGTTGIADRSVFPTRVFLDAIFEQEFEYQATTSLEDF
jgi:hypothetical protein